MASKEPNSARDGWSMANKGGTIWPRDNVKDQYAVLDCLKKNGADQYLITITGSRAPSFAVDTKVCYNALGLVNKESSDHNLKVDKKEGPFRYICIPG